MTVPFMNSGKTGQKWHDNRGERERVTDRQRETERVCERDTQRDRQTDREQRETHTESV